MQHKKLQCVRVSKYNNAHLNDSASYSIDWTSIHDVGKTFDGRVLSYAEYERIENQYLSLIQKICTEQNVSGMEITDLEDPYGTSSYRNHQMLTETKAIIDVVRDCLREKYWCKLNSQYLYFHFGYDYYLYIGSSMDIRRINKLVQTVGLFVEIMDSPYLEQPND